MICIEQLGFFFNYGMCLYCFVFFFELSCVLGFMRNREDCLLVDMGNGDKVIYFY